jgi:hypothetical protein
MKLCRTDPLVLINAITNWKVPLNVGGALRAATGNSQYDGRLFEFLKFY